jgi:CheY-like chemotaxis protein
MRGDRVLVVDDNLTNLKLVEYLLQARGYEVISAFDAESALSAVRAQRPSLVLLDLQLPGMDGLELTRQLKADPETEHIPIVAVTASAMNGDEERALSAGCSGYVAKPIDTRALAPLVERLLQQADRRPEPR